MMMSLKRMEHDNMITFNIDINDTEKLKNVLDTIKQSNMGDVVINVADAKPMNAVQATPSFVVDAVTAFLSDKSECTRDELVKLICGLGIKESTAAVYISLMLRGNVLNKQRKLYSLFTKNG